METGYIHIYTGNGKGKTTAALGLALRAAGAGLTVFIGQFVKKMHYSELNALKRFDDVITVRQYGRKCFIRNNPSPEDVRAAREGLAEIERVLGEGCYDMVILDEATVALHFQLFDLDALMQCLEKRKAGVELIITGRNAPKPLIDRADLVTEMLEVKHYYQQGVKARAGIEK